MRKWTENSAICLFGILTGSLCVHLGLLHPRRQSAVPEARPGGLFRHHRPQGPGLQVGIQFELEALKNQLRQEHSDRTLGGHHGKGKRGRGVHQELDQDGFHFKDQHAHHDDNHVAVRLASEVRVVCMILTSDLKNKARAVKDTWARRCNHHVFLSDHSDPDFPAHGIGAQTGRTELTAKTFRAFEHVYEHYYDRADWFLKVEDDTYIIVENLRYLLSAHNHSDPIVLGHHFKTFVDQGYFGGGAGYVLSKEALRRFGTRPADLCNTKVGAEDVLMGRCMELLDIHPRDSRDSQGRSRFHAFHPGIHIRGQYPEWYWRYDKYGPTKGIGTISDYPVSFHYLTVDMMHTTEYNVYHIGAYGVIKGHTEVNGPVRTNQSAGGDT